MSRLLIAWLNQPQGQILVGLLISVFAGSLALLENLPIAYLLALLLIFVPKAFLDYNAYLVKAETKYTHYQRIEENLHFLLRALYDNLQTDEPLRLALMLPKADTKTWRTAVDLNLTEAQKAVEFEYYDDQRHFAWMALALDYKQPAWMAITPAVIRDLLETHDPRDYECFKETTAVLAAPIFRPHRALTVHSLIGIIVIYGESSPSVLVPAEDNDKTHLKQTVSAIVGLMAEILCYDCLCNDVD